ncbi:MAG: uncharacterized protein JWQ44_2358 [Chthoniobacter sp.]|nr:uncharacterized protein [Chthoniobacter sp.]
MKGRHLLILLALVLVIGGAGYYLQKGNQSSWSSSSGGAGGKVLDFPINDVVTARLKSKDAELNLTKTGDAWTVRERGNYPANFEQVSGLLRRLWELKTVQEVKVGASQLPRLELVEPGQGESSGTLVEFKDKDGKNLSAVLLGKKHLRKGDAGPMGGSEGFPTGRYVMPVGSNKVSLVSDTLEDADPKPERWLRKDFIKVESPIAISMSGQTEAMRWKLTRENATAEWKLADAKPEEALDTAKVGTLGTLFSAPSFKDVLAADAKPEETGLDKPATATIETSDAFTYTLQIGKLTNEAYPVLVSVAANLAKERTPAADEKPEDKARLDGEFQAKQKRLEEKLAAEKKFEGRPFLLEKFTVEPLLKDRAALLAEKKPDPAASSAPGAPAPSSATTPPVSVPPAPPATSDAPTPAAPMPASPAPPAPTPPAPTPLPTEPPSSPTPPPPPAPGGPSAPPPSAPVPPASEPPAPGPVPPTAPATPPAPASPPPQSPPNPDVPPATPPSPSAPAPEPASPAPAPAEGAEAPAPAAPGN